MPEPSERLLPSFGRRRGRKLRPNRQALFDELLPKLQLSLRGDGVTGWWSDGVKEFSTAPLLPHHPTTPLPLFLEIGFGGGEHLAHLAELHPECGIIGCEPYVNGMVGLLARIAEHGLSNIRLFNDDARLLIERLPPACIDRMYILYPDPWRKTRHRKRRLISTDFLSNLARIIKPGGYLQLATDHENYLGWMLERLLAHPDFRWTAKNAGDWLNPPAEWISTRYEQKALAAGRVATYLGFVRVF